MLHERERALQYVYTRQAGIADLSKSITQPDRRCASHAVQAESGLGKKLQLAEFSLQH